MKAIFGLFAVATCALVFASASHAQAPADSTGECKDGTYTSAQSKRGACAAHGGVKDWYGKSATTKAAAAPSTSETAKSPPSATAAVAAPSGSTGQCKDGSYTSTETKRGACGGHGGVKNWYGSSDSTKPSAAVAPATTSPMATTPTPATPTTKTAATPMPTTAASGGGPGQVWVNTSTKVYHCSGDRYYGKTKQGEYMTEAAAKAAGNRADHGKACS